MIPIIIAKYLLNLSENGVNIEEGISYLIKSVDGDSYYMFDLLPGDKKISEELGEKVYDGIQDNDWSYEDILGWYKELVV